MNIDINANTDKPEINYYPAIQLNGLKWEVVCNRFSCAAVWKNVSSEYGNTIFSYYNGTEWVNATLDEGTYTIETLNDEIHRVMKDNGDYTIVDGDDTFDINFESDLSSGFVSMELTNGFEVDFTDKSIRTLFGFK